MICLIWGNIFYHEKQVRKGSLRCVGAILIWIYKVKIQRISRLFVEELEGIGFIFK